MALTETSLRNIIQRETNKLERQQVAFDTTKAHIEALTLQLDMFHIEIPTPSTEKATPSTKK